MLGWSGSERFGSQGTFRNVWDGALCLGSLGKLVFGMSSFGAAVKVSLSMGRLGRASLVRAVEVSQCLERMSWRSKFRQPR